MTATYLAALQAAPDWINENLFKWITNNGLAVVGFVLILGFVVAPLFVVVRSLIGSIGRKSDAIGSQIGNAVTLFSGTLSTISDRQERSTDKLTEALERMNESQHQQVLLLARINENQRITLQFITENMKELAIHRTVVEPNAPPVGVIQPVDVENVGGPE